LKGLRTCRLTWRELELWPKRNFPTPPIETKRVVLPAQNTNRIGKHTEQPMEVTPLLDENGKQRLNPQDYWEWQNQGYAKFLTRATDLGKARLDS
jgi:hypothetical protein